jgi:hypothetical protein
MRALIVFGALLLGIVGLLMSVCGGGFLLMSLVQLNLQMLLAIAFYAIPSVAIGAWFVYMAVTITRRNVRRDDTDAGP